MKTLQQLAQQLEARGLSTDQRRVIEHELALAELAGDHQIGPPPAACSLYSSTDPQVFGPTIPSPLVSLVAAQSLDHLLQRDLQREKDGFPRKIRVGKLIKPGRDGDDKVVVIPTTVEEKLIHDRIPEDEEGEGGEGQGQGEGGAGEGEEGEVIGEQPVREQSGGGSGSGQGQGGTHELESTVYDLGRILTEQFALPNLRDKGKKRSLTRFSYDLTDQNRGFGQILDKKGGQPACLDLCLAELPIPEPGRNPVHSPRHRGPRGRAFPGLLPDAGGRWHPGGISLSSGQSDRR